MIPISDLGTSGYSTKPSCATKDSEQKSGALAGGSYRLHPQRKGVSNEIQNFRILAVSKEIHFLKRHLLMHD